MGKILFCLCAVLLSYSLNAQIVAWDFSKAKGSEPEYEASVYSKGLNVSPLFRGGSLGSSSFGRTFAAQGFTINGSKENALRNDEYLWFSIDAQTGFIVSVFTLDAKLRRSVDGPTTYRWYYSVNDIDFIPVGDKDIRLESSEEGILQPSVILYKDSLLQKVPQKIIAFRLYAWGATSATGSIALGRYSESSNSYSLALSGIVVSEAWNDLTLVDFKATKNGSRTFFHWKTLAEAQSSGFEVMRSTDGIFFNKIDFVPSVAVAGYSTDILSYSYHTATPSGQKHYYRLRHIAFDGHNKFGPVVMVDGDDAKKFIMKKVFQGSATGQVMLEVDAPTRDRLSFCIIDISGRVVLFKIAETEIGYNLLSLDTKDLKRGVYYIKMICSRGETVTTPFVKQ